MRSRSLARLWLGFRKHWGDKAAVFADERLHGQLSPRAVGARPQHLWACGEVLFATHRTLDWEELAAGSAVACCRYLGHTDARTYSRTPCIERGCPLFATDGSRCDRHQLVHKLQHGRITKLLAPCWDLMTAYYIGTVFFNVYRVMEDTIKGDRCQVCGLTAATLPCCRARKT